VRNGSGIPINTQNKLAVVNVAKPSDPPVYTPLMPYMNPGVFNVTKDYTFASTIYPMKLVFFDLARRNISASIYSNPAGVVFANPVMNYYGDNFRVTQPDKPWSGGYTWSLDAIDTTIPHIVVVDTNTRQNWETGQLYVPRQVNLRNFTTPKSDLCSLNDVPSDNLKPYWPADCGAITSDKIVAAIAASVNGPPDPKGPATPGGVGYMLLNGRRLGNSGAIEAIPNSAIMGFRNNQIAELIKAGVASGVAAAMAGTIAWENGTRAGNINPRDSVNVKLACNPNSATPFDTCWIGRFGWLGDRVSLEDQVANAAFIEMGMTSSTAYKTLYPGGPNGHFPVRYQFPNCGLANKACIDTKLPPPNPPNSNGDLSEEDIDRMADYARWLGSPTRSEFTASLQVVNDGEQVFRNLKCNTCHVIDKIPIPTTDPNNGKDPNSTMMPPAFRNRLAVAGVQTPFPAQTASPFLSYLGTDLLMHDMGYLSQVGLTTSLSIRDGNGVVFDNLVDYVQKIRTPALKGLRFNRFVTDSFKNTLPTSSGSPPNPACDFLLHDGRACDAIQAAFLHDGPKIKALGVIKGLSSPQTDLTALRAFLYSL
jgi:hypothetical protein